MGRVRTLRPLWSSRTLLLGLPTGWVPIRGVRIGRARPLVRGAWRWSSGCSWRSAGAGAVVRAPLRLRLRSLRRVLAAVLALTLPTAS